MSFSDMLQIILSLIGFIVGTVISWIFFRAQQKTDFVALRDTIQALRNHDLKNIEKNIALIKESSNIKNDLQLNQKILELHNSIHRLNSDVNGLPQRIISDFRVEQHQFLERVNQKFNEKVGESQETLEQHLRKELAIFLPTVTQQDKLVERMSELVKYAMISMGKYQREVIEAESEDVLARAEQKVARAVNPVSEKIDGVDRQVKQLSPPTSTGS